jgi:tRNA (guanine-N7-)-methyltransferase
MRIEELGDQFEEGEVDEIWITFADPFPTKSRANRRLTAPRFIEMYKRLLKKGGRLHLKHDSEVFFDYSLEVLRERGFVVEREVRNVHEVEDSLLTEVQTTYEKRHMKDGRTIYYLRCSTK